MSFSSKLFLALKKKLLSYDIDNSVFSIEEACLTGGRVFQHSFKWQTEKPCSLWILLGSFIPLACSTLTFYHPFPKLPFSIPPFPLKLCPADLSRVAVNYIDFHCSLLTMLIDNDWWSVVLNLLYTYRFWSSFEGNAESFTMDCIWTWWGSLLGPLWSLCMWLFVGNCDVYSPVDKSSTLWAAWEIWQVLWPYGSSKNSSHTVRCDPLASFHLSIFPVWTSKRISKHNILLLVALSLRTSWIHSSLDYEVQQSKDPPGYTPRGTFSQPPLQLH